jgi:hypothetical protein
MNEFALINASKMPELMMKLSTVECKMLLIILCYLSTTNKELLIHNAEFREFLVSMSFSKTSIRVSTILSSMVKKGVLVREGQGVFSVPGNLFLFANDCKE